MQKKPRAQRTRNFDDKQRLVVAPSRLVGIAVFFLLLGTLLGWFTHSFYALSSASTDLGASVGRMPGAVPENVGLSSQQIRAVEDHIAQAQAQVIERPSDMGQRTHLGDLYYDLGRARDESGARQLARQAYLEAIRQYELVRAAGSASADVMTDLGTMYFHTDQPQKAVEAYEHALAGSPSHRNAWMNLGVVKREGLNDLPGAIAAWQQYLKLNPTGPEADRVRSWLSQAQASVVPGG